jgi:hypothetical protein
MMGYENQPFQSVVRSVGWNIYVQDESGSDATALLPSINQTTRSASRSASKFWDAVRWPWMHPPGAASVPLWAWLLTVLGRPFPRAGGTGDLRVFQNAFLAALALAGCVFLLILTTPFLACWRTCRSKRLWGCARSSRSLSRNCRCSG